MSRKVLVLLVCSIVALAVSPALLRAQGGPPPFRGGPGGPGGGFGRGRGGFRVIGVEGCLNNARHVPSGTLGYAASIVHDHTEASFGNGAPSDHSSTELSYRDDTGVTYTQLTLPPMGSSKTPRTVICINDPNLHIRLVVNPDPNKPSAFEYKIPDFKPRSGGGQNPQFRRGGPNGNNAQNPPPANPNVTISNSTTPPAGLPALDSTNCPSMQTTLITRTAPNGAVSTNERVYCPALFLELYSQNSDSHTVSTTTVTLSTVGGVSLASLPVPYPLNNNIPVTVVTPRGGKRNFQNQGGGAQQ